MFSKASIRNQVRILSVSTKESGSWLNALPASNLGLQLDDNTLRISVALILGIEVCTVHKCRCGVEADIFGHHGLCCKKSAGRISRHSSINNIINRALSSAHFLNTLEPPGLLKEDGKTPVGMTLTPWKNGKALVWDVTCVDSLADSNITFSMKGSGMAANHAERKKIEIYKNLINKFIFIPLGFETFGSWGIESRRLLLDIGKKISEITGEIRSSAFLKQRISIEIQRGNASCVFGTLPHIRGLDEIFYILDVKRFH